MYVRDCSYLICISLQWLNWKTIYSLCVCFKTLRHMLLEDLISDVMIYFSSLCACVHVMWLVFILFPCHYLLQIHAAAGIAACKQSRGSWLFNISLTLFILQTLFIYKSVYLSACILNFQSLLAATYLNCLPFFMALISDILLINGRETSVKFKWEHNKQVETHKHSTSRRC
jgi:hypothetical protein